MIKYFSVNRDTVFLRIFWLFKRTAFIWNIFFL